MDYVVCPMYYVVAVAGMSGVRIPGLTLMPLIPEPFAPKP